MAAKRRRGCIIERPPKSGSWSIIVNLGKDPETNKWPQHWETLRGTKRQAEQRLTEILREMDNGSFLKPSKNTVSEYLQDWLETVVIFRKPRTRAGYETIVRKHLVPYLGPLQLTKLTPTQVEKLYSILLAQGLSSSTVHHVHVCLSKALTDALRKGLLGRNVCKLVQAPTPGHYEVRLPELEGIKQILESAKETPYYAAFRFMIYTGVRRAEALALSWRDVDLERKFVSITRTLQRIGREGLVIESTKSLS